MSSPTHPLHNPWHNRIRAVMAHTTRYSFGGEAKLARDAGVSKSAVSRLVNGLSNPSFGVVCALSEALGKALQYSLDPREIVALNGRYPTSSICELCGCQGCSYRFSENQIPETRS